MDLSQNPWYEQHVRDEKEFSSHLRLATVRRIVADEFNRGDEPMPCECGGTAHYRATIGVRMCPDCRAMYHGNGDKV
jgi:ribosomal protein L37AE/L43A